MKPILLATDGSPSAAEATLEAIELATALDAPLVAIAVPHVTVPTYGYYGYAEIVSQLTKAENEHVAKVLTQVKEIAAASGVECDTITGEGRVVDEICRAARDRNARLIVIGADAYSCSMCGSPAHLDCEGVHLRRAHAEDEAVPTP